MRRFTIFLTCTLVFCSIALAGAQTQNFKSEAIEYTLELPSATWRATARPDSVHQHVEFVNGDRNDGYLRIRKEVVEAGTGPSDLANRDQDQKLRFLPGYVEGKEEPFAGRLKGITASYEYSSAGKPMVGRIYYLQADNRTIYTLHFTGMRDKLLRLRNQTDFIARSFTLK